MDPFSSFTLEFELASVTGSPRRHLIYRFLTESNPVLISAERVAYAGVIVPEGHPLRFASSNGRTRFCSAAA